MTDETRVLAVEDMGPVERAFSEAMHEGCDEPPPGHPLSDHSPWSGGDLDGVESWAEFTDRLARHGLSLVPTATLVPKTTDELARDVAREYVALGKQP